MSEWDVVIAGGGPVGLSLAMELGLRGVRCVVVEPRTTVSYQVPRAKTVSLRTMEHARRWGIAERMRRAAPLPADWPAQAIYCTSLTGHELHRFDNVFGMRGVIDSAEAAMQLPQPYFEDLMREVLAELPSVTLMFGSLVTGVDQDDDSVRVTVRPVAASGSPAADVPDTGQSVLSAQYAVGCDGAASPVRAMVGIPQTRSSFDQRFLNVVLRSPSLLRMAAAHLGRAVHYWVLSPEAAGVLGPMDGADTLFATVPEVSPEMSVTETIDYVSRMVGQAVELEILSLGRWHAKGSISDHFGAGRVFLAGDAAHNNPPWGGHGFNTGVGDAVNLGWKLAASLQGWGGSGLLASYDAERRTVALRTLEDAATNMGALDDTPLPPGLLSENGSAARAELGRVIAQLKAAEFSSKGLVLGYDYASSPLCVPDGEVMAPVPDPIRSTPTTAPGVRLPHAWLDDGLAVYDRLGQRFGMVQIGAAPTPTNFVRAAADLGLGPLPVVRVRSGGAAGLEDPCLLLVRPDQHIAWRGAREPEDVRSVLRTATGRAQASVSL